MRWTLKGGLKTLHTYRCLLRQRCGSHDGQRMCPKTFRGCRGVGKAVGAYSGGGGAAADNDDENLHGKTF
jgi:hypothetical protein